MRTDIKSLAVQIADVPEIAFGIPGATPGGITAKLINVDQARGIVTTVIHIAPGASIPAHFHNDGSESHYVLSGDFINDGVSYGPGFYLTHDTGVVHGPHSSKNGCQILTMQTAYVDPAKPDFHIVS